MSTTEDERKIVFEEGVNASKNGEPRSENPYEDKLAEAWDAGYLWNEKTKPIQPESQTSV